MDEVSWDSLLAQFAASKRDHRLYEQLAKSCSNAIIAFCQRLLGDRQSAEDVTQEVLVKLYFSAGSFRGQSSAKTWIFSVARNRCMDELRRRCREPFVGLDVDELEFAIAESDIDYQSMKKMLISAGFELSLEEREVVFLRFIDGFSFEEIAAIADISLSAAKMRFKRGLEKLEALVTGGR